MRNHCKSSISVKNDKIWSKMINFDQKWPTLSLWFQIFARKYHFYNRNSLHFFSEMTKLAFEEFLNWLIFTLVWLFLPWFLANFGQIAKIILLRYKNYIACMLFIYLQIRLFLLLKWETHPTFNSPLAVIVSRKFHEKFSESKKAYFQIWA